MHYKGTRLATYINILPFFRYFLFILMFVLKNSFFVYILGCVQSPNPLNSVNKIGSKWKKKCNSSIELFQNLIPNFKSIFIQFFYKKHWQFKKDFLTKKNFSRFLKSYLFLEFDLNKVEVKKYGKPKGKRRLVCLNWGHCGSFW